MRFWNRLNHNNSVRLTVRNDWSSTGTILNISHNIVDFNLKRVCEIDNVKKVLIGQLVTEWKYSLLQEFKLGTYSAFKFSFSTEMYVNI